MEYELYAACKERSAVQAAAFLDAFGPDREQATDEYEFPQYSNSPREVFMDSVLLIERLEQESSEGYGIYWGRLGVTVPDKAPRVMLFFTEDGGMIAGLVVPHHVEAATLLERLASVVGATYGQTVLEEPPPSTLAEFRLSCKTGTGDRIVDGQFLAGSWKPSDY